LLRARIGSESFKRRCRSPVWVQKTQWVSDPLGDLPVEDGRALALQALGPEYAHLAEHLAAATADCPLVAVVGGQLLAQRALPPELLETETEFRQTVLDRFRDEMLGRLGDDVDADIARETLVLISALGPVSVRSDMTIDRMAEDLGVQSHALRTLLSQLVEAGVLIERGRLRRIVPDVLADHILHRACIDKRGDPTARADAGHRCRAPAGRLTAAPGLPAARLR
jgi:hypothetical protein